MNINFPNSTSPGSQVDTQRVQKPRGDQSTQYAKNRGIQPGASNSEVSLSDTTVQALKAQLGNLPSVRQNRVQALQQAVSSGTYQVNSRQLADAIQADLFGTANTGS